MSKFNYATVAEFTPNLGQWTPVGNIDPNQIESLNKNQTEWLLPATNNDVKVKLYLMSPRAFRVRFNPDPTTDYSSENSYAVVNRTLGGSNYKPKSINKTDQILEIDLGYIQLKIGLQPYGIAVYRNGQLINEDTYQYNLVYIPGQSVTANFKKNPANEFYFGFGEKAGKNTIMNNHTLTFFNYDNYKYAGSNNESGNLDDGIVMPVIPPNNDPGPLNSSEPLYNSMPVMIATNPKPANGTAYSYALFLDNPGQTYFNLGASDYSEMYGKYYFGGLYNEMDYYFMAGDDVPDVISQYKTLTGPSAMPPMYALGYHQGCYGYYDQNRLQEAADSYRAAQIPIDGLHIDVDFQNNYRTFTNSEIKFPKVNEMFARLHKQGFKCSTNITGIITIQPLDENGNKTKYETLDTGKALKTSDGTGAFIYNTRNYNPPDSEFYVANENYGCNTGFNPYQYPGAPFHPNCQQALGTYGYYPNIGDPKVQEWWGEQYTYLLTQGLDMIWQDMTCPAVVKSASAEAEYKTLPLDIMMYDFDDQYKANAEIHNVFALNLIKSTYEGLTKIREGLPDDHYNKDKRNFIIGRGGFAGVHRYAAIWTGDSASTWDFLQINIPEVLNFGLSGLPMSGCDIGGFAPGQYSGTVKSPGVVEGGQPGAEMLARWITMGAFLPWFRNHYDGYTKAYQEPYRYDAFTQAACRKYIEIRYKLLQLFYDMVYENTQSGLPVARALFVNDPTDMDVYNHLDDQFFVGRDLLVAPVITPGATQREVYLPAGYEWYAYTDNKAPLGAPTPGGTVQNWYAPLDIVPMYVREGAIIPVRELEQYVGQLEAEGKVNPITYSIYPGADSTYICYQDDMVSTAAEKQNEYRLTKVSHTGQPDISGQKIVIERLVDNYKPQADFYYVSLLGTNPPAFVKMNGSDLPLINAGNDSSSAEALANSSNSAYYYNASLKTTYIKVFDKITPTELLASF